MDSFQEFFFPIGCQLNISGVEQAEDSKIHGYTTFHHKSAQLVTINATIGCYRALPSGNKQFWIKTEGVERVSKGWLVGKGPN